MSREDQQWLWWAVAARIVQLKDDVYDVRVAYFGFWVTLRYSDADRFLDNNDLQQALQQHSVAPEVQRLRESLNSMIYDIESAQWAVNFLTRLVTAQDNRFSVGRGLGLSIYNYDDTPTARDAIVADINRLVQTMEDASAVKKAIDNRLEFAGLCFSRWFDNYPTTNPQISNHVPPSTPEHLREVEELCRRIAGYPILNGEDAMVFVKELKRISFDIKEYIWLDPYTRKFDNYLCCEAAATGFSENEYDEYSSDDEDDFVTDSSSQPKRFTLSNDIEKVGDILGQMSKEEFTIACIPLWMELSKIMRVDPTLEQVHGVLNLLDPNSAFRDKEALKQFLLPWVLAHPVLCKDLFDVVLPRLKNHFRAQIGDQKAITWGPNKQILDYKPKNVDGWEISFSPSSIIVTPKGKFRQNSQPVLVDSFGTVYSITKTDTKGIPMKVNLPNGGKETKVFTFDKNWRLDGHPEIFGRNFSNATDAATYLITILCRDFYVESLVNHFVDTLQPLTEPDFEFLFGKGDHPYPLFMDLLSRCQTIEDSQITEKLVYFLLNLLTSNKIKDESLELETLFDLMETHKSTPMFLIKAMAVFEYCKEHSQQLQPVHMVFNEIVPFLETLGDCVFAKKLLKVYVEGKISKTLGLNVHGSLKDVYRCQKILDESVSFDDVFLQYFKDNSSFCLDLVQFVLAHEQKYSDFIKNTLLYALKGNKDGENNLSLTLFLKAFEDEDDDVQLLFTEPIESIIDFALRKSVCPNTYEKYETHDLSLINAIYSRQRIDFWEGEEKNYEEVSTSVLSALKQLYLQYPNVFPFLGTIIKKLPDTMVFDIFSCILKKAIHL